MPFRSCAQQRAMFIHAPDVAKRWIKETGDVCKGHPMGEKSDTEMKARADSLKKKKK